MSSTPEKMFLELYLMALSDAEIHPSELKMLKQIGLRRGITEQEIQDVLFSSNKLVSSTELSDDEKIEYVYDLAQMAWADGILEEREIECLRNACKRLGFEEQYVAEITDFILQQVKEGKTIEEVLETINNL